MRNLWLAYKAERQAKIVELAATKTVMQIAGELGLSYSTVVQVLGAAGVKAVKTRVSHRDAVLALAPTHTAMEIAQQLKVCEATVRKHLSYAGVKAVSRWYNSAGNTARTERAAEFRRRYEAGETAEAIAQNYNLSRERVCQILRKTNTISLRQERDRQAKEALAGEKAAAQAIIKAQLDAAVALVAGGMSHIRAGQESGVPHPIIALACKARGVKSGMGRWTPRTERAAAVRRMYAEGKSKLEITRVLRAGGDSIHDGWIMRHCPELDWQLPRHLRPELTKGEDNA